MKRIIITALTLLLTGCDVHFATLEVTRSDPASGACGVDVEVTPRIWFSEDVRRSEVEEGFVLENKGGEVEVSFVWIDERTVQIEPLETLDTGYWEMSLPRTIRDTRGNTMAADFIAYFYCGADLDAPEVIATVPVYTPGGTSGVAGDQDITIQFSEPMNRGITEDAVSLSPSVSHHLQWIDDATLVLRLHDTMTHGDLHALTVADTAEDVAGNPLGEEFTLSFYVGTDVTPPQILSVGPDGEVPWSAGITNTGMSRFDAIALSFSETMDAASVRDAISFSPSASFDLSWNLSMTRFVLTPCDPLAGDQRYTFSIRQSARDSAGNQLRDESRYTFTTDAVDSLPLRVGDVSASSDGTGWNCIYAGTPDPGVILTPAAVHYAENEFFLRITFVRRNDPALPVQVDVATLSEALLLENYDSGNAPTLAGMNWIDDGTVDLHWTGMRSGVLYRLTIHGGERGVKDRHGNAMTQDVILYIEE